ncbi:MAG: Fur family transcriptional regulator [Euryarchaeota archaeon]|jgi:Fur family ferric uptake transcriptional regulator/Fur family peroxide stress response transcriptional regulator|nr:Fur family transcriptional regulator [Euryarchaeota archaeon]
MYEKYVKTLKDHSIKITSQRLEILKYLNEHHTHPNVEEIYSELKKKHPSLSRTTVYNSLEILKKNKIVQSLTISGSELRYDIEESLHHHFLCKKCGAILDISITCPNMDRTLDGGHRVEEVQGYFKGICKNCQTTEKGRRTNG